MAIRDIYTDEALRRAFFFAMPPFRTARPLPPRACHIIFAAAADAAAAFR